jgi:hypothetical protein
MPIAAARVAVGIGVIVLASIAFRWMIVLAAMIARPAAAGFCGVVAGGRVVVMIAVVFAIARPAVVGEVGVFHERDIIHPVWPGQPAATARQGRCRHECQRDDASRAA